MNENNLLRTSKIEQSYMTEPKKLDTFRLSLY